MIFTVRLRRIVKSNEQREQSLHPSSISELKSFLQILLSKILQYYGCNRSMPLKNCYVEVKAQFLLEKDNAQRRVTAFAKVLSTFLNEDVYEYKNKEDELTEKLLFLNNVDVHLFETGKLATSITKQH